MPTHKIEKIEGASIKDYRDAGRAADDTAGRELKIAYGPSSNANFDHFRPALESAMKTACDHMLKHGASKEAIFAWRCEFNAALKPHLDQFAALQRLLGKASPIF